MSNNTIFRPIWNLAVLLAGTAVVTLGALPAAAADCWGGTARRTVIAKGRLAYVGTVTFPGASHENVVGPDGFGLEITDAEDPERVLYSLSIPAEEFEVRDRRTVYDGSGDFGGTVVLKNRKQQADTVWIRVRVKGNFDPSALAASGVRARFFSGETCARSCVSSCREGKRLACRKGAVYVPFDDAAHGALQNDDARDARTRSPLCGLSIPLAGPRCDDFIEEQCLLPYPSSVFLDPDAGTPTGLRIHYDVGSLPTNSQETPIDPTDWNTLDGFSPGPILIALFPDTGHPVDLTASDVAFHTDFARSLEADHPTVLMHEDGARVLHFGELDVQADDVARKALLIRPGVRLEESRRYLVAIRNLVDTQGTPIQARLAFRALRDGLDEAAIALACGSACAAKLEARRANLEDVFARLASEGVARDELLLAWDFTVASVENITGAMVAIRDHAYSLGTPTFTVDSVDTGDGSGFNEFIYARIQGTFQPPLYMTFDAPGARMNRVAGEPAQNGFANVPYVADIPYTVVASENPAAEAGRGTTWGHGLLGSRFQLGTLSELAETFGFVVTAVDMQGMSSDDTGPAIIPAITDFSLFHRIPERLHQGFLNHLLLGRLMADPNQGFNSHAAFQLGPDGAGVFDTSRVYYSGGSQGGIFGGAIMGISEEFERGFLAVPAANYSTLLQRSIDFNPFFQLVDVSYPDKLDQSLIFPLIQQIWDRGEPQGYYPHIVAGTLSDPPFPHKVLLHMATYDSEVSNLATEIQARSMGIPQISPVARSFFDVAEDPGPVDGSALVEINPQRGGSRCHTPGTTDAGAACSDDGDCPGAGDPAGRTQCASGIPPLTNDAPLFNNGAHGSTGNPTAGLQINAFLDDGGLIENFCTGPCDPE